MGSPKLRCSTRNWDQIAFLALLLGFSVPGSGRLQDSGSSGGGGRSRVGNATLAGLVQYHVRRRAGTMVGAPVLCLEPGLLEINMEGFGSS